MKYLRKGIALLLVLLIVVSAVNAVDTGDPDELPTVPIAQPTAPADPTAPAEPTPDAPSDEELIAQYDIPDNWARPALLFAVRTGLMTGKADGALCPTDYTTRAEVATMLMRILQTQTEAPLSGFADMNVAAWYNAPMAKAVAAGLFTGDKNGCLSPNANITREQAFTVLSRAFGVLAGDPESVYAFSDGKYVGNWAKRPVAALLAEGCIQGSGGKLNPKGYITRQELAQVLYNLLSGFGTELPADFEGSYALAADGLAPGTVVHGDLLLSGEAESLTLENVTVEGRLVVQGVGRVMLRISDCSIGTLTVCRPATVQNDGSVTKIEIGGANTTLFGTFETVAIYADTASFAGVQTAEIYDGSFANSSAEPVGLLRVYGGSVQNNGAVDCAEIYARDFCLGGSGKVGTLKAKNFNVSSTCTVSKRVEELPLRIQDCMTGVRTDSARPTVSQPAITLTVRFNVTDPEFLEKTRYGEVQWYLEGMLVSSDQGIRLTDNLTLSCTINFNSPLYQMAKMTADVEARLVHNGETLTVPIAVDLSDSVYIAARNVRTQNVQARLYYDVPLYANASGAETGRTVYGGTQVTLLKYTNAWLAWIRLSDGTYGWVPTASLYILTNGVYYTTAKYAPAVKECYVNRVRNYKSSTRYLVWVSLWTQEVNVFEGSQGQWVLIKSFPCSSGANYAPTPCESVKILYHSWKWYYDDFYVHHISVFDEARGFHTIPICYDGTIFNGTLGQPISHGCIRLKVEDTLWIYDNLPIGTAVEIY